MESFQPVGGGCISDAYRVAVGGVQGGVAEWFVKCGGPEMERNYRCEAKGLAALREASRSIAGLTVPEPVAVGAIDGNAYLILPFLSVHRGHVDGAQLGRCLAQLHQATRSKRVGWHETNFLGASEQINAPEDHWPRFVRDYRIEPQVRWAIAGGHLSDSQAEMFWRLLEKLPQWFDDDAATSLLHGDLWSGNVLKLTDGRIALIDPAVYYGTPEAEWGMMRLFGGFGASCESAYHTVIPKTDDWDIRVDVFVLYHLLNHLNLFGGGYREPCLSLCRRLMSV